VYLRKSSVRIEAREAPAGRGGTTRRSRSYGKEFQRRTRGMQRAPNADDTFAPVH